MKTTVPILFLAMILSAACSRRNYASSYFDQQTAGHKLIAVLPSEIIFTGKQPRELTPAQIDSLEVMESRAFQQALYSNILEYANSRRYFMYVGVQDINTTLGLLEKNGVAIRSSWRMDDRKLAEMLGVDAIVRMQITQKRYMSDYASYGVSVGREILSGTSIGNRLPIPRSLGKTEDIYAYCSLVSNSVTLWNNNYKSAANWNNPSNEIIENITENFGRNFPYKRRK
jgi:hypothetical protein